MTSTDPVLTDAPTPPGPHADRRGLLVGAGVLGLAVLGAVVTSSAPPDSAAAAVLTEAAALVPVRSAQDEVAMAVVDAAGAVTSVAVTSTGVASPADLDDPVPVGALSDLLTAAAVLRLVEAGLLDVETPVSSYLPDRGLPGVTVRHLLQHTSGLPERSAEPGVAVRYSPENEALLREVVTAVTGRGFDEVLATEVVAPARLQATSLGPGDATRAEVLSTPADLARLLRALHDGTLLSPGTREAMTDRLADVTGGGGVQVGLGLMRFTGFGPLVGSFATVDGRYLLVMHAPGTQTTGVWSAPQQADVGRTLRPVAEHLVG